MDGGSEQQPESTPHARGSTWRGQNYWRLTRVYPACAGIHLSTGAVRRATSRLPRMRGDPPLDLEPSKPIRLSTPHARGSTLLVAGTLPNNSVYPACAGIHPKRQRRKKNVQCLPRMRGDPPLESYASYCSHMSTPHARGSTWNKGLGKFSIWVYPACAGIHPTYSGLGEI